MLSDMRFVMKLMGIGRLMSLALSSGPAVGGSVRALTAELEHGSWKDSSEVRLQFPHSGFDDPCVTVCLDAKHCVALIFNYDSQIVLVKSAGRCESSKSPRRESGIKP